MGAWRQDSKESIYLFVNQYLIFLSLSGAMIWRQSSDGRVLPIVLPVLPISGVPGTVDVRGPGGGDLGGVNRRWFNLAGGAGFVRAAYSE